MKKIFPICLLLVFGLFFCSSGERNTPEAGSANLATTQFSELGFAEVLALAQQQNKHILVDFFSPT